MSFFYMMDDLRYLFFFFFLFFSFFFFFGGGGWSSSRWLFGTQLGWCHAVGLAVPQTSAATFGGERSDWVWDLAKPIPTTIASEMLGENVN